MLETGFHVRQGGGSRIALALVVSVAVHALILYLMPGLRERARFERLDPHPLVARLAEVRPAHVPEARQAAKVEPPPQSRGMSRAPAQVLAFPGASSSQPRPAPIEIERPQAAPAAARQVELSTPPVQTQAEPATVSRVEPPTHAPERASPTDAVDPASVGLYRNALIVAAKRYRKYPRVARENNWEGQAEVRLAIDANGAIVSISIQSRSGYEVLDRQALEMIRKAKPMAPLPAALRGKGFVLDLPVLFSLKEETG